MKVAVYSALKEEQALLRKANAGKHELFFIEEALSPETTVLAEDCRAIAISMSDVADAAVLKLLAEQNVKYIVVRGEFYENIDLLIAGDLMLYTANAPKASPYPVADTIIYNLNCFEKGERSRNELWHSLCRHCENKVALCS